MPKFEPLRQAVLDDAGSEQSVQHLLKLLEYFAPKGSRWKHKSSGRTYRINGHLNVQASNREKWPVRVIYQPASMGTVYPYERPLLEFIEKFERL